MRLSTPFSALESYPFVRLRAAKERLQAAGVEVIDFSTGEPREATPEFIRTALSEGITEFNPYPAADGLPELRAAIADWIERRYAVALDPGTQVVPTLGSKEAIFSLAALVGGELVAAPTPSYPVPERGALFAGKEVLKLPLRAEREFLPDLGAIGAGIWAYVGLLWLNYPNNPTGATAPLEFLERAAALARRYDFLLACDEAYSELYFGAPPVSALELPDLTNVVVVNTLSKRSAMPGLRSGWVAGDAAVIDALKRYRPNVGTAPQAFVQRASVAAWSDESHVAEQRAIYAAKRSVLEPACAAGGLPHVGGEASMFLWLEDPGGRSEQLLEQGIVLTPGDYLGPAGAGYARLALVPPLAACERAAEIIAASGA